MGKLLALIPDDILSGLAIETKVDYNAKKLQGEVIFKLLLYCLLATKECSMRTIASAYETAIFSALNARYAQGSGIRRATCDRFTEGGIRFVYRINAGAKHEQAGGNRLPAPVVTARLIIEEDTDIVLFSTGKVKTRQPLRCIKAKVRTARTGAEASGDKELWFVTNIGAHELDAAQ